MGHNFYDYDGLQPKTTPPKHISQQCKPRQLQFWSEPSEISNLRSSNTQETVAFTPRHLDTKLGETPNIHKGQ